MSKAGAEPLMSLDFLLSGKGFARTGAIKDMREQIAIRAGMPITGFPAQLKTALSHAIFEFTQNEGKLREVHSSDHDISCII